MIEPELERVAHVVADRGDRPAERADEADLERLLGERRRRAEGEQRDRSHQNFFHVHPPKGKLRRSYLIGECVKSPLGVTFRLAMARPTARPARIDVRLPCRLRRAREGCCLPCCGAGSKALGPFALSAKKASRCTN